MTKYEWTKEENDYLENGVPVFRYTTIVNGKKYYFATISINEGMFKFAEMRIDTGRAKGEPID